MRQFGLNDPLLDQLVKRIEIERLVALEVALNLCRVVLKGYDLHLELLVKKPQLLFSDDVFHSRDPSAPAHDQITTVVPSFALSSRASKEVGLLVAAMVGHWREALVLRMSQCLRYVVDC